MHCIATSRGSPEARGIEEPYPQPDFSFFMAKMFPQICFSLQLSPHPRHHLLYNPWVWHSLWEFARTLFREINTIYDPQPPEGDENMSGVQELQKPVDCLEELC